jgi:hypothetical protein
VGRERIVSFSTAAADESGAAADIAAAIDGVDGLTVLFATTEYDLGRLGKALARRGIRQTLGAATGCTIGADGFLDRGVAGFHLPSTRFEALDEVIENVGEFGLPDARKLGAALRARLSRRDAPERQAAFGFVLVDAEARCEERLIAAIGTEFAGLPLVGGSAGDLFFKPLGQPRDATQLLHRGRALRNAAVLCLVCCDSTVQALSHNHYRPGQRKLVITAADHERRLVREINGRPALPEYAAVCGLKKLPTRGEHFASHPLMIRIGGQYFARGVQRAYADGSIEFACAIESGVVATVATPEDMVARLREMFTALVADIGAPELVIGFECAARTAYMRQAGLTAAVADLFRDHRVSGFATLGEQFNTIHVNNSFTALAIAARPPA